MKIMQWLGNEDLDPKDVYKKSVLSGNSVLVGRLEPSHFSLKERIVFNVPDKCIEQINYESPNKYHFGFETCKAKIGEEIEFTYIFDDEEREIVVMNQDEYRNEYIGCWDNGKIIFYDQYLEE